MLIESACLLLGIVVGFIGSFIFIAIIDIFDKEERISQLWKLLLYFGGSGGVPSLIIIFANELSPYWAWYIIGLVPTFLGSSFVLSLKK
jgi:hypothetical protein